MIRVLHVISGLNIGGAELMLKRLVESHHRGRHFRHSVISLTDIGEVGLQLREIGAGVEALGMRSSRDVFRALLRLVRLVRTSHADIVQTWMYHADLLGGLAAYLAGNRNVIWCIRSSEIPQHRFSRTHLIRSICARMSSVLPRAIVCCARSARVAHATMGYNDRKMCVIPNGYQLTSFNGTPLLRQQARTVIGVGCDVMVIGVVGRFDPLKDYRNFVLAAERLASTNARLAFVMVGRGLDASNAELLGWLADSHVTDRFVLMGERRDIPRLLAGMDVFCLPSRSEAFPNVVCEAMATKVPCVVTDVGDAADIVAATGVVVIPGSPPALAEALQEMLSKSVAARAVLGEMARLRIHENYSIEIASAQYGSLYERVADGRLAAYPEERPAHE